MKIVFATSTLQSQKKEITAHPLVLLVGLLQQPPLLVRATHQLLPAQLDADQ